MQEKKRILAAHTNDRTQHPLLETSEQDNENFIRYLLQAEGVGDCRNFHRIHSKQFKMNHLLLGPARVSVHPWLLHASPFWSFC